MFQVVAGFLIVASMATLLNS